MDKIVSGFRLNEIASKAMKTPFRFFFISVKTGAYLTEAMNWLVVKHLIGQQSPNTNILSFDMFLRSNDHLAHIHDNSSKRNEVSEIITVYKNKWKNSPNSIVNLFEEINYNEHKIFFASYPDRAIIVTTDNAHVDKAMLVNLLDSMSNLENDDDINIFYTLFEQTKDELLKCFQTDISQSLSCDISMEQSVAT